MNEVWIPYRQQKLVRRLLDRQAGERANASSDKTHQREAADHNDELTKEATADEQRF